jgi:hypothetical protein
MYHAGQPLSELYLNCGDVAVAEFDLNHDGHLTAEEAATALASRGVKITATQVQKYIAGRPPGIDQERVASLFPSLVGTFHLLGKMGVQFG